MGVSSAAMRRAARVTLAVIQGWLAASTAYLLGLLWVAARTPVDDAPAALATAGAPLRIVTFVPAHDEAAGVAETIAALRAQSYPAERHEVIVIADNCSDETAAVAAAAGATVWQRAASENRGKGQALAWALERLARERTVSGAEDGAGARDCDAIDAIAVVDADCLASPGLLASVDRHLRTGADAVQTDYVVANPDASTTSALRYAGFALMHRVRARGKAGLGLSVGLFGSGMAFSAALLRAVPWASFSVTEDAEYHVRVVEHGTVVRYAGEASVSSAMPTTDAAAREQQLRWESGNSALARSTVPRLLVAGLKRRDRQRLHAAVERLVPPQTLLLAASMGAGLAAIGLRARPAAGLAAVTVAGQAGYVVVGLRVAGAPPAVRRVVRRGPLLALRKLTIFGRIAIGRGAGAWVRTQRG